MSPTAPIEEYKREEEKEEEGSPEKCVIVQLDRKEVQDDDHPVEKVGLKCLNGIINHCNDGGIDS